MSLQQLGWPRLFVQDMMRMSGSPVSSRADFGRGGIGRVRFLAAPGPARRRWSPSPRSGPTWSKANRWAWRVSHLQGCQLPLARGKNLWGELKHPQAAISRGLSSDLIWPGSSAHWGTKGWCCKKTTSNPWHHWWMPPCRMVLNNSVKSNMTYSHKPVLFSVWRLYFFASFQDCASGSTLRWTTKMPDKGTIQRFNVNSSHLSLQLLNLKAGGKKESVKTAAAIVLIFFYYYYYFFFLRHQVDFFSPQFWHTIPSCHIPIPVSVCFAFWARRHIIFHFNSMISQQWLSAARNVIFAFYRFVLLQRTES